MQAAYNPAHFALALTPSEMDTLVEAVRIVVRDYEVAEPTELLLAVLEKAYGECDRERAGGRVIELRAITGPFDEAEEDGGSAVAV